MEIELDGLPLLGFDVLAGPQPQHVLGWPALSSRSYHFRSKSVHVGRQW